MPTFAARQRPHLTITRRNSHANPLLQREPAPEPGLINLPLPLPSIPLLNPLITPLVGGNNRPAPTHTHPATPPPPPPPGGGSQPTSGGGGGGGNGNGNGNGGGNGNGNGGSSTGGGNGNGNGAGNGNGNAGSTGGGGVGGGSGTSPSNGSSSPSNGGDGSASGTGGAGSGQTPNGTGATSTSSSSGSNFVSNDGNTPINAGNDPNDDGSSGNGGSSTGAHNGHGGSGPGGGSSGITVSIPGVSGTPRTGGTENGGSGGGDGGVDGSGASSQGGKTGGLSGGAIGGIVVAILLILLLVIIIILRRRRKSRRSERQNHWWFSREQTSQAYGDRAHGDIMIGGGGAGGGGAGGAGVRKSVRSSFETTVDHSQTPRLDMDFDIPALPPMAELRGEPVLVNLDTAISPKVTVTQYNSTTPETRFSVGTVSSLGSDEQGQWLIVNRDGLNPEIGTPMSVRPFSPTESFAFPKPPTDKGSGDWSSQFSRPPSSHTLNTSIMNGPKSPIIAEELPALPIPSPTVNPFSDPDPIALHAAAVASFGTNRRTPSPINVAAANNPFADPSLPPEPTTPSAVHPEFMEVEIIKRPFIPTLEDELPVEIGDKVKILKMFDDGWSLVEKNPVYYSGGGKGKGKGKAAEKGLIPIDCFRDHGLEVSDFIATKRVSSYSQTSSKFTAGGAAF